MNRPSIIIACIYSDCIERSRKVEVEGKICLQMQTQDFRDCHMVSLGSYDNLRPLRDLLMDRIKNMQDASVDKKSKVIHT